ncbi:unnamed protein product [Gongylonema pulchrum]|uniref:Cilia- and flagella-associated protein 157 n=1 Tax=Gongylonema pulchrum TaxID=637853 RepID=A0A183DN69_9BILA|nr:unnamed protein product [Gongylonema pulchrum]
MDEEEDSGGERQRAAQRAASGDGSSTGGASRHPSLFGTSSQERFAEAPVLPEEIIAEMAGSSTQHDATLEIAELKKENALLEQRLFLKSEELDSVCQRFSMVAEIKDALERENEALLREREERMAIMLEHEMERDKMVLAKSEELDSVCQRFSMIAEIKDALERENEALLREREERMAIMLEHEMERDKMVLAKNECQQKADMLLRRNEDYEANINTLMYNISFLSSQSFTTKSFLAALSHLPCFFFC